MSLYIRQFLVVIFGLIFFHGYAQEKSLEVPMSYEDALNLLKKNNKELMIAEKGVEIAKEEKGSINSFWYPRLSASGAYVHLSNKIEVRQSLSKFTTPLEGIASEIFPDDQIISGILKDIGAQTFSLQLAPQNITTIDANLIWPVFTGGKRYFGTKIGRAVVEAARKAKEQVNSLTQLQLVETYYGVRLGESVVKVKKETWKAFEKQYSDALALEREGIINKAERLVVQVGMEEARREYETSVKDYSVAQSAFKTLINYNDSVEINATSPLFINNTIQGKEYFKTVMRQCSRLVEQIEIQKQIFDYEKKIAAGGYSPEIAFMGRQNIYAHGVSRFLVPRNMIGVGFTWNIFDGLDREKNIRKAKLSILTLELEREKAIDDLSVGIDKAYSSLQNALDNITALKSTISLSKELLKVREKSFLEGMATSTEVVDARVALSNVQLLYLAAYYQYDLSLMTLLSLSGIPDEFETYKSKGKTESFIFE